MTQFKGLPIAVLFCILTLLAIQPASAGTAGYSWKKLPTQSTIIFFQDDGDLNTFNKKIQFTPKNQSPGQDLHETIAQKVDALFERSQQILDMHGFVNKIAVKVFKNRQQLDKAFQELYQKQGNARAWYSHDHLTVYIQLDDLHEGMLAHEFAHAVIDHYLIVPPPGKTAEILARHVDKHLHRQVAPQQDGAALVQGYSTK